MEKIKNYTDLYKDNKIKVTKLESLIKEKEVNKWESTREFISTNLVATRYVCALY